MTPKERMIAALTLNTPDMVPTFELEFQLEEEMFGRKFMTEDTKIENLRKLGKKERDAKLFELAEYYVKVYTELEYSILPAYGPCDWNKFWKEGILAEETIIFNKYLKQLIGDEMMLGFHGDGTMSIPDGNYMYELSYSIVDDPEGIKADALKNANMAIERNKKLQEAGIECLLLCSDYCYNSGPFLSPAMFEEFIQPYLYKIIDAARRDGLYTIKHTDGNIMPILNQLVECRPHALHSIDPMAGVDIKEVKRLVGDKVCLCGNVNCACLQTGTEQDIIDSAVYCLTHAKPNGGYVFCTSNVPFKGMDPMRYKLILDVWKSMRSYDI